MSHVFLLNRSLSLLFIYTYTTIYLKKRARDKPLWLSTGSRPLDHVCYETLKIESRSEVNIMFNVIIEMSILNFSLLVCCYERLCVSITQQKQKIYTGNLYSVPLLIALTLSYVHVLTSVNIKVIRVNSFINFTSTSRLTRATALETFT